MIKLLQPSYNPFYLYMYLWLFGPTSVMSVARRHTDDAILNALVFWHVFECFVVVDSRDLTLMLCELSILYYLNFELVNSECICNPPSWTVELVM
jgi:hypothetical protein